MPFSSLSFQALYLSLILSFSSLFSLLSNHSYSNSRHNRIAQQNQKHLNMAVEARHLNLFPSQLITNREVMNSHDASMNMYNAATHMGYSSFLPLSGAVTETVIPIYDSHSLGGNAVKSESSLTCNNNGVVPPMSRKRSRDNTYNFAESFSFLGQDISHQIQQQQLDVEHLIMQRMEKVRREIDEKRKRQARRIIEAIEVGVMKKLKAKEEEIEKIGKQNWALEERVKTLCMENQIWRELAQTNEATANALRNNLEQVLAQRGGAVVVEDDGAALCGAAVMDDAESCCDSNEEEEEKGEEAGWRTITRCAKEEGRSENNNDSDNGRLCRNCGKEESSVLMLPCRHLCLCKICGSTVHACPMCKSFKTGSVHVNMSWD